MIWYAKRFSFEGNALCHILATVGTHAAKLHAVVAWLVDLGNLNAKSRVSTWDIHEMAVTVLGMRDNGTLLNLPAQKLAVYARLVPGREGLVHLPLIPQVVTFCYSGLVEVVEQRLEPFDIVVRPLQQIGDGDGVVQASRQS